MASTDLERISPAGGVSLVPLPPTSPILLVLHPGQEWCCPSLIVPLCCNAMPFQWAGTALLPRSRAPTWAPGSNTTPLPFPPLPLSSPGFSMPAVGTARQSPLAAATSGPASPRLLSPQTPPLFLPTAPLLLFPTVHRLQGLGGGSTHVLPLLLQALEGVLGGGEREVDVGVGVAQAGEAGLVLGRGEVHPALEHGAVEAPELGRVALLSVRERVHGARGEEEPEHAPDVPAAHLMARGPAKRTEQ